MALPVAPAIFRSAVLSWMPKLMADFGFSDEDAAAVLGNAGHESNGLRTMQEIKPTVAGSRGGLGPFQWTGPRRRDFEAWLARQGAKPNDLNASYAFLFRELIGPEKGAVAKTKAAKGLAAKVKAFEMGYERAGVKHYPSREQWAQVALNIHREAKPAPVTPDPIAPTTCPTCGQPWPHAA